MTWIDIAGASLSALALLGLVVLLLDWNRGMGRAAPESAVRPTLHGGQARSGAAFGGAPPEQGAWRRRLVRWVWPPLLIGSFLAGLYGLPLRTLAEGVSSGSPHGSEGPTVEASGSQAFMAPRPVAVRRSTIRAPFYRVSRREERLPGRRWQLRSWSRSLQLPWAFLLGGTAYLLATRWRRLRW